MRRYREEHQWRIVIPTRRAEQLVAYLRSLKSSGDLPEAPVKKEEAK